MKNWQAMILGVGLFLLVVGLGKGWFKGFGEKLGAFIDGIKEKFGKKE